MNKHDELIETLSRDLKPVSRAPNVNVLASVWILLSAGFVVIATHLAGPLRPGVFEQLVANPRFLLECLLGVTAIAWVGVAGYRSAIPAGMTRKFALAGVVLMCAWLAQYVLGLFIPALEPSTAGARARCYLETMAYAVPPIVIALIMIRRLYPMHFVRTSMALALAAGMLPALYMQLACMYVPLHILEFHILPGLAMVLFGALLAGLLRRRSEPPGNLSR